MCSQFHRIAPIALNDIFVVHLSCALLPRQRVKDEEGVEETEDSRQYGRSHGGAHIHVHHHHHHGPSPSPLLGG